MYNRRVLTYYMYCAMLVLGIMLTVKGATVPVLMGHFHISEAAMGTMLVGSSVGWMVAVLIGGVIGDLANKKLTITVGLSAATISFSLFGWSSSYWTNVAIMMMMGTGCGFMEGAVNSLIIDMYPKSPGRPMNFTHFFFGVGAILGPLIASAILRYGFPWQWIYTIAGVIAAIELVLIAFQRMPPKASSPGDEVRIGEIWGLRKEGLLWLLAVILALYVGAEVGVSDWMAEFLRRDHSVALALASVSVSLFWGGLTLGRFICTLIAHWVSPSLLAFALSGGAFLSLVVAFSSPNAYLAVISLFSAGLFFSGIFPTVVALGGTIYIRYSGSVVGFLSSFSGVGATVIPRTMAEIAERTTLRSGLWFYAAVSLVMVFFSFMVLKASTSECVRARHIRRREG
ncbi:MAG: MFS transporter [bacterium]